MASSISKHYWTARWWLWDTRDALLVKQIARLLKHNAIVYVHRNEESKPFAVLVRDEFLTDDVPMKIPHSHIEGKSR